MLKFFRQYNKYILVIGGSILMVAFLIQPTLSIFMPSPGTQPIGTIDGEPVTVNQQRSAAAEIELLGRIRPELGLLAGDDSLRWLLMTLDAQRLGLSASGVEVRYVLEQLGLTESVMAELARNFRTSPQFVEQTVRHWLMVEQYKELVQGLRHVPAIEKLQVLNVALQARDQGDLGSMLMLLAMAEGSPRLSDALARRFIQDRSAAVAGELVLIRPSGEEPEPDPQLVQRVFDDYKNALPGTGEPYGFGYRLPDRVRIEYLAVPLDAVRQSVVVDEADALAYYQDNPQRFVAPGAGEGAEPQPYLDVRSQVIDELARRLANEKADRMIKTARAALLDDLRALPEESGYRVLPEGFEPIDLDAVADRLAEQFGVRPTVRRFTDNWLTLPGLSTLPRLGASTLANRPVPLTDYVNAARELEPDPANPLIPLRLQVGVPSEVMASPDGARLVFRLTAAEASHSPESLDVVREQVVADARSLAAYRRLQDEADRWAELARQNGLDAVAAEAPSATRIEVPPLPRRVPDPQRGGFVAPPVPGIGQSAALVDAAFAIVDRVGPNPQEVPAAERITVVPIDRQRALAVFRLDRFDALTRQELERGLDRPELGAMVNQLLLRTADDADPLSIEAISARLGFVPDRADEHDTEADAEAQAEAGGEPAETPAPDAEPAAAAS